MSVLLYLLILPAILAVPFGFFVLRLLSRQEEELTVDWLEGFSLESYRPMQRLLNERDYRFLAAQPGYRPGIAKELRAERKKIFRAYLRQLITDFNRLVKVADLMLVYSAHDRPDLAQQISRAKLRFYLAVCQTELCLTLQPLPLGNLTAANLIDTLALVRDQIQRMVPEQHLAH